MNPDPILQAAPVIQAHVASAIVAVVLGPFAIFRRRRDRIHKALGYLWSGTMLVAATTALFISEIRLWGPFSPIHLLSPLVYWSLWRAISKARAGQTRAHRTLMTSLYVQALGIAGLFTLWPGRIMSDVLFASAPWAGFAGMAAVMALIYWIDPFSLRRRAA